MNTPLKRLANLVRKDTWVKPFFARYKRVMAAALGLGFLAFCFAAALMFASGYLVSGAAEVESILLLHMPLVLVRVFGVGKPVLTYFERLASHDWVLRMTSGLRLRLYRALESDPAPIRAARRTGEVLGLLSEDIGHVQNLYLRTIFPTAVAWLLYAALVAVLGFLSLPLALAMLLAAGTAVFVAPLVSVAATGARHLRAKQARSELYVDLTDNVLGVADWVFSQRGDDYLARHERAQAALRAEERAMARFARRRDTLLQAVYGFAVVLLLVWAALHFGATGEVAGGAANWIAAFALGFFPLIEAFAPLSAAAVDAGAHADSVANLNALGDARRFADEEGANGDSPLDEEPPAQANCLREESENAAAPPKSSVARTQAADDPSSERPLPSSGATRGPRPPLDIVFDDVTFRYDASDEPVLRNLSLTVREGEKAAVLGRSGAGKSTLLALLRGDVRPETGRVRIGGIDPADAGDRIAHLVGVIPQNPYLFNMTLLENVRLGAPNATREQVRTVLSQVQLDALVDRLPDGIDTMVDEAGLRFSGGERHRVALARVLLQDAPVVVLDEPAAGLDPATEAALLDTLWDVLAGKTIVMVTHHLQGASRADRVAFIAEGNVTLQGAPDELERESAFYRELLALDRADRIARSAVAQQF